MRKKSKQAVEFIQKLHNHIASYPSLRLNTKGKSEQNIQTEIRPYIIEFLVKYFKHNKNIKDYVAMANRSFYWEGQEGQYNRFRKTVFGARNYPDFIITKPYKIAIEYKKSDLGSIVKHAIGQSIIHTMSGDYDFVYCLIKDESKNEKIVKSISKIKSNNENEIIKLLEKDFNVFLNVIGNSKPKRIKPW